jgi:hypothetical protein
MQRWLLALAIAVASLPGGAASADSSPIAVLAVEISGDAAPELRPRVAEGIAAGLTEAGRGVVALSDVMRELAEAPELMGCTSTACLERIAERVGASEFLRARLRAEGVTYTIELELLSSRDAEDGRAVGLEADCTVCTMTELFDWVSATTAELLLPQRTAGASIVIQTDPPGATVEVDGRSIGPAPAEAMLPVGHHDITARLDGHSQAATTIRVHEGDPGPHVVNLVLLPDAVRSEATAGARYSPWKWMAAGGAAAGVLTSVAFFATHGNPTCTLEPPQTQCPRERNGITPGFISLGVGAALGGASGWMFYRDAAGRSASVSAGPGDAGAAVVLSF